MDRDTSSGDKDALIEAIEQLVDDRFADVNPELLEAAFDEVVDRQIAVREGDDEPASDVSETSSGWTGRIDSGLVRPVFPDSASISSTESEVPTSSVEISAESTVRVQGLLHQLLEVGAVLVELQPTPVLNEVIELTLEFPEAHLTINTRGRVVHNSGRGTAVEVSSLGREDRVALRAMHDDLDAPPLTKESMEAPDVAGDDSEPSVDDSIQDPGAVPTVQENDDPRRSFAPLGASRSRAGDGRSRQSRRMVSTSRRRVDLPDPDMHVATSARSVEKVDGKTTREFYGPPPRWLEPTGDVDRIEELTGERVLDILLQLSEDGFTGMLVLEVDGTDQEQLVFDSGYVVERSVRPRVTEEELGPMLLAADRITKRQLAMAAAHADELGLSVGRSLMELGVLNPDDLRTAIAGRLTFLLREVCEQRQGAVRLFDGERLPTGFLPQPPLRVHVAVERIIFDRLFRRLSQKPGDEREDQMEQYLDTYPEILAGQRDRLERAVTDSEQVRFVEQVITGENRMREVMTESALGPSETFAILFSLHRMGLLRFDRSLHDTVVRERRRENITVKHLSVHKASYFEVLNVHWSSYSGVIEEAYNNLVEQFDPDEMPDDLDGDLHEKVGEINERLEAAYAALSKRKTRHAYRTRIMPEYKLEHAIPLFLKQCELAERRQNWANARDAIRRVLEIAPDHEKAKSKLARFDELVDGDGESDPVDTIY